ncbi:MAG: substrate-binding domain-containing protein [Ruminococcus flavefaciens]|nr:substrate-binding domain-containing protein [Ruminococcus flavefaciens]MCM1362547.1 substrate-binding domain-containing protein [Clostridiales bacterium]
MRKRICVILIGLQSETARRTVEGISAQASVLGYDVFVFSYFDLRQPDEKTIRGAANILSLIDPADYDAFIIHKGVIVDDEIRYRLMQICENSGKPVIDLDAPDADGEEYPLWNDREKFRILTEHLITEHNHKKIYCITGFKGFHQSENRLLGYRDALLAHGIEPHDEWEFYGDFWNEYTTVFAERLASGEISMPDAVVCAATIPAVGLIDGLKKHGISVPQDIAVVGYDCFAEVIYEQPAVTFISFPNYNQGIQCVCRIHKMLTGKSVRSDLYFEEKLCTLDSCGCHSSDNPSLLWLKNDLAEQFQYQSLFRYSGMQESLSSTDNAADCFKTIYDLNYLIRGIKSVHYCLCDDWDGISYTGNEPYRSSGYSERLLTYSNYYPGGAVFDIRRKKDIPDFVSSQKRAGTYFFFPMHYSDRTFGFAALEFKDIHHTPDSLFWSFMEILNNALETIRIRYYITRFSERQRLAAIRDNLTGFYNRRGFEEISAEMYEYAVSHHERFFLVAIRLYNLEQINQELGYETGDRILLIISDVIGKLTKGNETPSHYKGGKFYVVGTHSADAPYPSVTAQKQEFLNECRKQLADFEETVQIEMEMEVFRDFITEQELSGIISELETKLNKKQLNSRRNRIHMTNIYDLRKEIYKNPQKKWTVSELARMMSLSDAYFQRMYKKTFQVSVSTDLIHARIEMAKLFLSEGTSIAETAEYCGYSSDVYFMHQFKKETGKTPTEWINRHINDISKKKS